MVYLFRNPVAALAACFVSLVVWAAFDMASGGRSDAGISAAGGRHVPVYRIPLRVHLGRSAKDPHQFADELQEINLIWLSQAGICFEMEVVSDDKPGEDGLDIWFAPVLAEHWEYNGYYRGDHDIWVRDTPVLGSAAKPAHSPAARTAAHEFGHSFGLPHRQDSDDNLMRSKTYGWQLNEEEVVMARLSASRKAMADTRETWCGPPRFAL